MTFKAHSDEVLEAAFRDALTRPAPLSQVGKDHGVSGSLISKMRIRAAEIAAVSGKRWPSRSIKRQLLRDGWVIVRRASYRLPIRTSPIATLRNWSQSLAAVIATTPIVRWIL